MPWDIEDIQRRLADLGYDAGDADGLLGPRTRAALRAFQADRGLLTTGLPDGETQRALFGADPSRTAADPRPPTVDPPNLEAVPLEPVRVTPLPPSVKGDPNKGLSVETSLADEPREERPPIRKGQGQALPQRDSTVKSEPLDQWFTWGAFALIVVGALVIFAVVRRRSTKQETATAEPPEPISSEEPSTTTVTLGGHVFGIDIPPSGDSRSG